MRKIIPFVLLLVAGCGESDPVDGAPKSRTNEGGEIERHLRHIANDGPAAQPFPSAAARPTTPVLPDTQATPGQAPPTEAARARAISETHVHEHEHVDEPDVAPTTAHPRVEVAAAEPTPVAAGSSEAHIADEPTAVAAGSEVGAIEAAAPEAHLPEDLATSQVELTRVVAASSVTNREPTGVAPFANDTQEVFLFVEARNDGEPTTLAVRWIAPDGSPGRSVQLQIPTSRRWRTWATTRRIQDRPGNWTAIVTDAAGRELGRSSFEVSVAPSA